MRCGFNTRAWKLCRNCIDFKLLIFSGTIEEVSTRSHVGNQLEVSPPTDDAPPPLPNSSPPPLSECKNNTLARSVFHQGLLSTASSSRESPVSDTSSSSGGSDITLVERAEETYMSSLFQTEPLYQFYDTQARNVSYTSSYIEVLKIRGFIFSLEGYFLSRVASLCFYKDTDFGGK